MEPLTASLAESSARTSTGCGGGRTASVGVTSVEAHAPMVAKKQTEPSQANASRHELFLKRFNGSVPIIESDLQLLSSLDLIGTFYNVTTSLSIPYNGITALENPQRRKRVQLSREMLECR